MEIIRLPETEIAKVLFISNIEQLKWIYFWLLKPLCTASEANREINSTAVKVRSKRMLELRHYEKTTKFEKITNIFWQNSCFHSVVSKQVGDFFKFLLPFQKSWTLQNLIQRKAGWIWNISKRIQANYNYSGFILFSI
jgi:hypothetical protein